MEGLSPVGQVLPLVHPPYSARTWRQVQRLCKQLELQDGIAFSTLSLEDASGSPRGQGPMRTTEPEANEVGPSIRHWARLQQQAHLKSDKKRVAKMDGSLHPGWPRGRPAGGKALSHLGWDGMQWQGCEEHSQDMDEMLKRQLQESAWRLASRYTGQAEQLWNARQSPVPQRRARTAMGKMQSTLSSLSAGSSTTEARAGGASRPSHHASAEMVKQVSIKSVTSPASRGAMSPSLSVATSSPRGEPKEWKSTLRESKRPPTVTLRAQHVAAASPEDFQFEVTVVDPSPKQDDLEDLSDADADETKDKSSDHEPMDDMGEAAGLKPVTWTEVMHLARKYGFNAASVASALAEFKHLDVEGTGYLTRLTFLEAVRSRLGLEHVDDIPHELMTDTWRITDSDHSGLIEFEEFLQWSQLGVFAVQEKALDPNYHLIQESANQHHMLLPDVEHIFNEFQRHDVTKRGSLDQVEFEELIMSLLQAKPVDFPRGRIKSWWRFASRNHGLTLDFSSFLSWFVQHFGPNGIRTGEAASGVYARLGRDRLRGVLNR
eukprot:CAMPEP_0178371342 /NCGR_PEP_ID=MMETSP0689_2-20121128/776_1 /TAXON_ID=160604 /ORGANISM="Amphidinium massartii, Strain CS-259" /LENGTH=545 /DNA_ID=CAMNT_0019991207 /DNA_START=81 /DNA_END=1719 /DNA_ORIENTATION=+